MKSEKWRNVWSIFTTMIPFLSSVYGLIGIMQTHSCTPIRKTTWTWTQTQNSLSETKMHFCVTSQICSRQFICRQETHEAIVRHCKVQSTWDHVAIARREAGFASCPLFCGRLPSPLKAASDWLSTSLVIITRSFFLLPRPIVCEDCQSTRALMTASRLHTDRVLWTLPTHNWFCRVVAQGGRPPLPPFNELRGLHSNCLV